VNPGPSLPKELGDERRVVIEVPQKWRARDYALAAQMFLEDLANVEGRGLADVVRDVHSSAARQRGAGESRVGLVGQVVALSSQNAAQGGVAVIRGVLEGRRRQARVTLSAVAYQEAIEAHRDGLLVRCLGDLAREGRSWVLSNPKEFGRLSGSEAG
jgi:hypothetical protein